MARPQPVIRARPVVSTRTFDWLDVNMPAVERSRTVAYSLETSVDNVARVEVIEAFHYIRQLAKG